MSFSHDGGFLFSAKELETATRLGLSFTHNTELFAQLHKGVFE